MGSTSLNIDQEIAKVPAWWHNIEIHGRITPGINSKKAQDWITSFMDEDLSGKTVLDIGAWDGFYSFLAEKRGAKRVVAIDPNQGPCRSQGFEVAHKLLESKVEHRSLSVYDMNQIQEQFDRILFLGVYYHMDDPFLGLYRIFERLKPGGEVLLEGLARSGTAPYLYAYQPGKELSPGDFCAATISWFNVICERIGFSECEFLSRYPGDNLFEIPIRFIAWHSRLHIGKLKKSHRVLLRLKKPLKPLFTSKDSEARDEFLYSHLNRPLI